MITNKQQYEVTMKTIAGFRQTLDDLYNMNVLSSIKGQAYRDAIQSQLDELQAQVNEYEALHPLHTTQDQ